MGLKPAFDQRKAREMTTKHTEIIPQFARKELLIGRLRNLLALIVGLAAALITLNDFVNR